MVEKASRKKINPKIKVRCMYGNTPIFMAGPENFLGDSFIGRPF